MIKTIDEMTFLSVFEGVPHFKINKNQLGPSVSIIDFLTDTAPALPSKSEVRRAIKENSISINKVKIKEDYMVSALDLINDKYIIIQRGKKNYFLISVV